MGTLSWPEVILVCLAAAGFAALGIALWVGLPETGKWLGSKFRR
jgi:hypothetical protein